MKKVLAILGISLLSTSSILITKFSDLIFFFHTDSASFNACCSCVVSFFLPIFFASTITFSDFVITPPTCPNAV